MPRLRLALAQTNPVIGDFSGNADQIAAAAEGAWDAGAGILLTGEMALSGYPVEDLALQPSFLRAAEQAVVELAARLDDAGLGDLVVIVGHPDGPHAPASPVSPAADSPTPIARNAASILHRGEVRGRYAKHHLPNYSVFDEYRVFRPGEELLPLRLGEVDAAILVCEDLWRGDGPVEQVREAGVGLLLVLNASPFERDKSEVRLPLVTRRASETGATVAYANIVGGQDDLVFDGDSVVVAPDGAVLARAGQFRSELLVVDVEAPAGSPTGSTSAGTSRLELPLRPTSTATHPTSVSALPDEREQLWNALVLGLRDYVEKNGFPSVVLGLSGGIDSAVCAAIAVDALGPDRVHGVSMPSRWSSDHSRSDADDLADRLGIPYSTEAIAELVAPIEDQLKLEGVAAENLQARIRGIILMAASNMHGHLVLTTGNKTELAVGYSTIYGDSVGGFAPLKDVPKTLVWELARWRNEAAAARGEAPPIPENSITKPPSAELRPDQTDQDSLPDYPLLDAILDLYLGERLGREEIIARGFEAETVRRVVSLVEGAEWKRRQGAIGPRISGMAFGRDRRLPITKRPVG